MYSSGMPENPNLEGVRYRNWKLVLPHQSGTYAGVRKPAIVPWILKFAKYQS